MIIFTSTRFEHASDDFSFSALKINLFLFLRKKVTALKEDLKKVSHHTHLRENEDWRLWGAAVFNTEGFDVRTLIRPNHA